MSYTRAILSTISKMKATLSRTLTFLTNIRLLKLILARRNLTLIEMENRHKSKFRMRVAIKSWL